MAFVVAARVLMVNAPLVLAAGNLAVRGGETVFDFAAVTECDSSLLACLLEWRREAVRMGKSALTICNVPTSLRGIARLYGVEVIALG